MEKAKHTPGPWRVTRGTNGFTETWQVAHTSALRDKTIADCGPVEYVSVHDKTDTLCSPRAASENAANAALIASAPALLAALVGMVEHRQREHLDCTVSPYVECVAAIAAARGGQS